MQQLVGGEQLGKQPVELAEVGEDHVPAQVPGEAGRIDHGRGKSAGQGGRLQQRPRTVTQPLQLVRAGQATRAGAENDNPLGG